MSENKNVLEDKDGNIVCYLQEPKCGGIDLYDEYNKGVDKIVSEFAECADKLSEVGKAKDDKEKALEQNEWDKGNAILKLTEERKSIEQQINVTEAEQLQESRNREAQYEYEKGTFDSKQDDWKSQFLRSSLSEKEGVVHSYGVYIQEGNSRGNELVSAYDWAETDLSNALEQLNADRNNCEKAYRQTNDTISELEADRKNIFSDEVIQREVEKYNQNSEKFQAAWNKYYLEHCNSKALTQEKTLKEQTAMRNENLQSEIEQRTDKRLEQEGLLAYLREQAALLRDEEEIEKRSINHARNTVLGNTKNTSEDNIGGLKYIAMLIFCYPKELLFGKGNRQFDWLALIPAILFMVAAYLHKPTLWFCIRGWLAVLILFHVACFILKVRGVFRGGWPVRLIGMIFYPIYIFLLMRSVFFCAFVMLLCLLLYFAMDIRFNVLMRSDKNQKKYNEAYEEAKALYQNKIRLTEEAVRKQQQYHKEEEAHVQAELQQQQSALEQLSLNNQKELETLQNAFQTEGWPLEVEAWKEKLLETRTEMRERNAELNRQISGEKSELQRTEYTLNQIEDRYAVLKEQYQPWIENGKNKFHSLLQYRCSQQADRLNRFIRTYLHDAYSEEEAAEISRNIAYGICKSEDIEDMTQIPAYKELQLGRIDWYRIALEELPDRLEQAKEELEALSERLRSDAEAKAQECEKALMSLAASHKETAGSAEMEYEMRKEEADKSFLADQEEIKNTYERRIKDLKAEGENIDSRIRETETYYQEREEKLYTEYDNKIAALNVEYRKEIDSCLKKLEENGMAEVCGFNYQQAWMHFHALATNTIGFPAYLDFEKYMHSKNIFSGLTAKAFGVNHEHCEFLPNHFVWGYSPVENAGLPSEIVEEIADTLRKNKELQEVRGWNDGDKKFYHVEKPPVDTFYKLNCTKMQDGPAMIVYDLGDLEKERQKKELFMDFILRTFVFSIYHCVGNADHLQFHIISSKQYEEYFSDFRNSKDKTPIKGRNGLHIHSEKSDVKNVIKKLRESREALDLGNDETLFSRNCKRSKDGRNPAADYEVLVIANTRYSEFEDTDLTALLQGSVRKKEGMYSYLLVDIDMLRQMDGSERERTVESIQKFANYIESDERFYKLDALDAPDNETKFQIALSSKDAVMAAIENCDVRDA